MNLTEIKIAMIEPHGSGGISHYSYQLCNALTSLNLDVTLFSNQNYELLSLSPTYKIGKDLYSSQLKKYVTGLLSNSKKKLDYNLEVGRMKKCPIIFAILKNARSYLPLKDFIIQIELLIIFLRADIRVVHFQWAWPDLNSIFFIRLLKLCGIKVVYTAHNLLPHDDFSEVTKRNTIAWYHAVDRVIVHSKSNFEEFKNIFKVDSNKVKIIPHGNYGFFRNYLLSKNDAREIINIPISKKVILFFGAIRKYKGLENLLKSFSEAKKKSNDLFLLIAGMVSQNDIKYLDKITSLIKSLKVNNHIKINPNYISFDNVGIYFSAVDVVVLPYLKTYQSGIIQLAYSFEKPVIVTDTGGLLEVVEEGKSGFIVPVNDQKALTEAILNIFNEDDKCEIMGRNAYHLSKTKFACEPIAKETLLVYEGLMK